MMYYGFGWTSVLIGAAVCSTVAAVVVKADRRMSADAPAPGRVLYSYGSICAGISCFSLGKGLPITASSWVSSNGT